MIRGRLLGLDDKTVDVPWSRSPLGLWRHSSLDDGVTAARRNGSSMVTMTSGDVEATAESVGGFPVVGSTTVDRIRFSIGGSRRLRPTS